MLKSLFFIRFGGQSISMKLPLFKHPLLRTVAGGMVFSVMALSGCSGDNTSKKSVVQNGGAQTSQSSDLPPEQVTGDPERGEMLFGQCEACHTITPGDQHLIGPNLANIMGSKSGVKEGYSYSTAMVDAALIWDATTMDKFLTNPTVFIPRSKMMYPGIYNAQHRADLIAYLSQITTQ